MQVVLFLGGVHNAAQEQQAATALLVDDEDERPVDDQSRGKSREHGSGPRDDVSTVLVDRHNGFMKHLRIDE